MLDKKKQGKKNRRVGKEFELEVRKDLESKGWIVSKWSNQVEFIEAMRIIRMGDMDHKAEGEPCKIGRLIPAKPQFNPFLKRIIGEGSGFPDFIAYRMDFIKIDSDSEPAFRDQIQEETGLEFDHIERAVILGIECKVGKYLDAIEKEKCKWLLDQGIFTKIFIARKPKTSQELMTGEKIIYEEFQEK